jgi:hypothetical protein
MRVSTYALKQLLHGSALIAQSQLRVLNRLAHDTGPALLQIRQDLADL